jgi:chromosome partitioning protein
VRDLVKRMQVITVAMQKGGVAKSTLAIHIAAEAVRKGKRAAILELDRQGTASQWSEARPYTAESEDLLKGVDRAKVPPEVVHVDAARLHIALAALADVADLVVIDLPGTHSSAVTPAIRAADLVLIPSRPNDVDLKAAADTLAAVDRLKKDHAFVFTFLPAQGGRAEDAREYLEEAGRTVAPGGLRQLVDFSDAIAAGKTVQELKPNGKAAEQVRALWKWIEKRLQDGKKDETAKVA